MEEALENKLENNNIENDNKNEFKVEYKGIDDKTAQTLLKTFKVFKVIILGLHGVGKTTISKYMELSKFLVFSPTISVDIIYLKVDVNDESFLIQLWDICGNDDYAASTPNLFKNASLAMIVYAINDKTSFENVNLWNNLVLKISGPDCIKYLIGNKKDLEKERKISEKEGEQFKEKYSFNYFLETSPKTDCNIKKLVEKIAISLYEKIKNDKDIINNKNFRLSSEEDLQKISGNEKGGRKSKKRRWC